MYPSLKRNTSKHVPWLLTSTNSQQCFQLCSVYYTELHKKLKHFLCKINQTTFTKVGFSLISLFSHILFISNHKRHLYDVEPSYKLILRLIQSAVYLVSMTKYPSWFVQIILKISQILTKIGANNCPTSVPNLRAWVCKLE